MNASLPTTTPDAELTWHQRRVIDYFDQTADDYRRLWRSDRHFGLHCGYFDRGHRRLDAAVLHMNRILAELAGVRSGDHVLDAGCGIGGSAIWLSETIGCRVTGVNICQSQLSDARRLAERRGVASRIDFVPADFCRTQLVSDSMDVVWALESCCYAEDKSAFLDECRRLLKPGGRLVVGDVFLTREELAADEARIVEKWQDGWAVPNLASVQGFRQALAAGGWKLAEMRDITRHVVPSSNRILRWTLFAYPFGLLLYWIGRRTQLQTRGIASGYYQYRARKRGLGVYCLVLAIKPEN